MNNGTLKPLRHQPMFWVLVACATVLIADPALAQSSGTGSIQSFADNVKAFLTGTFAKTVAVIALAATGFRFFTGRASAEPLLAVIGGIFLIFGATWLLNQTTGG